jgi:hypothetical protein
MKIPKYINLYNICKEKCKLDPGCTPSAYMKDKVLWDIALCSSVDMHERFMGTSCLRLHGGRGSREGKDISDIRKIVEEMQLRKAGGKRRPLKRTIPVNL